MVRSNRCVPLVFDYVELRLRMPLRPSRGIGLEEAGLALPISRLI